MQNQTDALPERVTDIAPENRAQVECEALIRSFSALIEAMTRVVTSNTEALDRVAAATGVQNARMEALEKQIRLNMPMSPQQARCLNAAIRQKARELLAKRGAEDDATATRMLCNSIRKSVLTRYGVGALTEIPRQEYPVALTQVLTWNDALCARDAVKAAQERRTSHDGK